MKCSIKGCPGEYEQKTIIHTVHRGDEIIVFEHVPAEVCSVCGDTVLAPDTIRHLEKMLRKKSRPEKVVPVYDYT